MRTFAGLAFPLSFLIAAGGALVLPACGGTITDNNTGGGGEGGGTSTTTDPSTGGAGGAPTTDTVTSPTGGTGGTTTTTSTTSTTTPTSTTTTDPWAGPIESLAELDLGEVTFNAQIPFPIPEKTLGFTVQAEGLQPDDIVGVFRLRPPSGNSVILNYAMSGHDTQVFGGLGFIAASDPQADSADAWPVKPGSWKVTFGSDGNSGDTTKARVWVRRTSDGAFHGGVVDVNLFIVQGVATTSYMNQVLNAFFPYAGLEKGTVNIYSADSSFATISSQQEYRDMLKATGGVGDAPAINLFVVDNFSNAAFGGAIGVAGGIPGSPMRHGTTQSGLAYDPSGDPGYDATVLMHEIGHLGGLFHTTEFQIVETDPLSDTAECPSATIQNNPGQCPDKSNVMFPIAYGATTFTNAQLIVLQGSALYRGILEAGGVPSPPLSLVAGGAAPSPFVTGDALDAGVRLMPAAPDPLERALGAVWCGGHLDRAALAIAGDPGVTLHRAKGVSAAARLRGIALDAAAPLLLRKRALQLYVTAARADGTLDAALTSTLGLASATSTSIADRRLRTAALRLLLDARSSASQGLAAKIDAVLATARSSSDTLVAAVAAGK
ncbi:MAG: hypothetical protein R3B70_47120 [Polyangiaceae bacterium]